jgi:hypothetical protein
MGYAGPSSGTEERLIIANAVDCMRTLRARACTRQRPEGTPRPTLQPLFAAPPLHSCSSLERSLPACPCAADDAIVIDCMVKGLARLQVGALGFVSRAAHLLAPGGVTAQ